MNKKIIVLTDFDSTGSGYRTICVPILTKLAEMGHEIKVIGLMYRGDENTYPFSVIPCQNFQEGIGMIHNLMQLWNPDVILCAMDLPIQAKMYEQVSKFQKKYIAITPLENGPLTMSWAIPLFQMDKVFFISQLGADEAEKVGVPNVEHLQIGVDTVSWHPATPEEKIQLRRGMNIPEDAFVVLTVADNQERKNLWAGMECVSRLKGKIDRPIRYILVTRIENPYGWNLKDLQRSLELKDELLLFERGLPQKDLWGLYALSDVYLQPSKAEGLGLPVMDAMACGIPVVATDTGALHELLQDKRGWLIPPAYSVVDVWGNSKRDFINIEKITVCLKNISDSLEKDTSNNALEYIKNRNWNIPTKQIDESIKRMFNDGTT